MLGVHFERKKDECYVTCCLLFSITCRFGYREPKAALINALDWLIQDLEGSYDEG